jgi:hypothetical protein
MANNLTPIIDDLWQGLDVISRELVGAVPSVARNSEAERAALGQTINYPISQEPTVEDVVPQMTLTTPPDFSTGVGSMTISKSKKVAFGWNGDEQRRIAPSVGYQTVQAQNFGQAVRKLCNLVEIDVIAAARVGASRAFGTAGTTPFGSNFNEISALRKILDDNGTAASDRSLIIDTGAGMNLRNLSTLTKVNESGSSMGLRDGQLLDIHGFSIKESAGVRSHTKGTGTSYQLSAAAAVGATALSVDTGSGTILAGDVITLAGDTNKYIAAADLAGGVVTIAKPGLRVAAADNTVVTVGNNFTGNIAFQRNAIQLVTRAPAIPAGGDARVDEYILTDPRSGLAFEVSMWKGERMNKLEVALAWGVEVVKAEDIALLLG